MSANVVQWSGAETATEAEIRRVFASEGLQPHRWSNAPGDVYSPHEHSYHKVIYVVSGSITFGLPHEGQELLHPGDRLDLPPGIVHSAQVGPQGVVCLEAQRGYAWRER